MRKLPALLAIAGLTAFGEPAFAQEKSAPKDTTKGFYVTAGVGGGWSSSPSASYTESGSILGVNYRGSLNGTQSLGGGVAAEAGIGYDFGNNIRGEVTYVLNNFAVGSTSASGNIALSGAATGNIPINATVDASGNVITNSVFVSGYYDIPTKSKFTPYFGAGLGWTSVSIPSMPYSARVTVDGASANATGNTDGGSASAFGYLAKIGVSYAVAKPADIYVEGIYQGNTGVTITNIDFGALNTFSARAGVRYRFGS